jgi:hypothetical protein
MHEFVVELKYGNWLEGEQLRQSVYDWPVHVLHFVLHAKQTTEAVDGYVPSLQRHLLSVFSENPVLHEIHLRST